MEAKFKIRSGYQMIMTMAVNDQSCVCNKGLFNVQKKKKTATKDDF